MSETNYRQKIAVQDAILNYVQQLITNNNISAIVVEEALNKVIIQLHPLILQEVLIEEDNKHEEEKHNLMHQYGINYGESIASNQEEVGDGGN